MNIELGNEELDLQSRIHFRRHKYIFDNSIDAVEILKTHLNAFIWWQQESQNDDAHGESDVLLLLVYSDQFNEILDVFRISEELLTTIRIP